MTVELHGAGETIAVRGDGFCWEYAVNASFQALENPMLPTDRDYAWLASVLQGTQDHLKKGMPGASTLYQRLSGRSEHMTYKSQVDTAKLHDEFLALKPARAGMALSESNYGGSMFAFPALASYLQIGILVLSSDVLKADLHWTSGPKKERVTVDTPLGHLTYFKPGAEYEQNLTLAAVKKLVDEGSSENVAIVVHNGKSGTRTALKPISKQCGAHKSHIAAQLHTHTPHFSTLFACMDISQHIPL